jgi:hypothetical protein
MAARVAPPRSPEHEHDYRRSSTQTTSESIDFRRSSTAGTFDENRTADTAMTEAATPPFRLVTQSLSAESAGPAGDGGSPDSDDEEPPPVTAFARTLYIIAHGDPKENLCEWSKNGERIVFRDPEKFAERVCPRCP